LWPLVKANVHELIQSKKDATQKKQESVAEYRPPKIADNEPVGHTGQTFGLTDYRKGRFDNVTGKYVNENVAANLVKEDPVVVADQRVVCSSSGGPLGHPKVYINLDKDEVQDCNYSGRRFIHKKYYDSAKHGKSITYQQYLDEMAEREKSF
jgi:NADH dehydrogenase (ubiquinone) Fe-S protein 6